MTVYVSHLFNFSVNKKLTWIIICFKIMIIANSFRVSLVIDWGVPQNVRTRFGRFMINRWSLIHWSKTVSNVVFELVSSLIRVLPMWFIDYSFCVDKHPDVVYYEKKILQCMYVLYFKLISMESRKEKWQYLHWRLCLERNRKYRSVEICGTKNELLRSLVIWLIRFLINYIPD